MNYQIKISSRDKLFFNDARPLGGSSVGSGANWPLPNVFHSALLSALHEIYDPSWESEHKNLSSKELRKRDERKMSSRFKLGGLKTFGPFPSVKGEIYFPAPSDIEPSGSVMTPIKITGEANLPYPLQYSVANTGAPSKDRLGEWISASELVKYLKGEKVVTTPSSELYLSESAPGIGIDPKTRAHKESQFFQAEYLRLNDIFQADGCSSFSPVEMTAFATCEARKYSGESTDVLDKFFKAGSRSMLFGGQRGIAYLEALRSEGFNDFARPESTLIKWVLLSPALFNNGWLPDWVDKASGKVRLKSRPAKADLPRSEWRKIIQSAPEIGASLKAAKIPKSTVMSGWKLDPSKDNAGGVPKETRLAVSAGSVYYFECETPEEAKKLVDELHCKVKSNSYGEQGFGLGFCGNWELKEL